MRLIGSIEVRSGLSGRGGIGGGSVELFDELDDVDDDEISNDFIHSYSATAW